jgi:hypothetical protein
MNAGSAQHVKKLFVNLRPKQIDHSPVVFCRRGHSLRCQQGTNLQLAGTKIVRLHANHAARLGAQLA